MLRVGIIDYVNILPLFHALKNNIISHNATFTLSNQSDINNSFLEGKIDIACISAAHFLEHRLNYILLSNLGVGATTEVISIRLFTKKTPSEFDKKTLFISPKNTSSNKILQSLCNHFWNVTPVFTPYTCEPKELFHQDMPFLLIGDECLKLMETYPHYPSIDLAYTWHNITKKSCLFTVIATRNEAFFIKPQEVIEFQKCLERSFCWAQNNNKNIINEAIEKTGCSSSLLQKYFSVLEYQLTPKHFNGLDYLSTL